MMKKIFLNRFSVRLILAAIVVILGACATNVPIPVNLDKETLFIGSSPKQSGFYFIVENKTNTQWRIKKISNTPLERRNDSQEVIFIDKDFGYVSPAFYDLENIEPIVPVMDMNNMFKCSILSDEDKINQGYSPCGTTKLAKKSIGNTIGSRLPMALISMGLALVATPTYLKTVNREMIAKILKETNLLMAAKAFDRLFIKNQAQFRVSSPDFLRFGNFKPTSEEAANSIKIARFEQPFESSISLWNVHTGREIVKFFTSATNDEWIAITPEGYYTASQHAAKYLTVSIANRHVNLAQYQPTIRSRPDIIQLALNKGDTLLAMKQLGVKPPISVAQIKPSKIWFVKPVVPPKEYQTQSSSVKVVVKVENFASNEKIQFTLNQRSVTPLVGTEKGKKVRPTTTGATIKTYTQNIPLQIGHNWIHAQVTNNAGIEQRTKSPLVVVRKNIIKKWPNLYYLGIGVAKYRQASLKLKYAAKDVTDLERVFKQQQGKAYRKVITETLTDNNATRSNLNNTIKTFFKNAQPGDIAILFISGHGMNTKQGYHFLTSDAHPEQLESTGVSWETFNSLGNIDAHVMLLADTCHAGNITGNTDWQERAKANPRQFLRDANLHNVIIFASSSGADVSQENDDLQNGVFTEALIEGLNGKAADKDGIVDISLLQRYVRKKVPQLTNGTQNPTISIEGLDKVLDLVLTKQ